MQFREAANVFIRTPNSSSIVSNTSQQIQESIVVILMKNRASKSNKIIAYKLQKMQTGNVKRYNNLDMKPLQRRVYSLKVFPKKV